MTTTHRTLADYYAGLPVQRPQLVTIYAAIIEWPSRLADAEPSLILARSEAERDEEIGEEIRGTAGMQSADTWTHAIDETGSEDWRDWLASLDEHAHDQPYVTTYERVI